MAAMLAVPSETNSAKSMAASKVVLKESRLGVQKAAQMEVLRAVTMVRRLAV